MKDISQKYEPVSTLKVTLIVILVISILFPVLFAYINNVMSVKVLSRELILTPIRLGGITIIANIVIVIINRSTAEIKSSFVRHIIEFPIILFLTYWWLYVLLQSIEAPIFCNCTYATNTFNFRQYIGLYFLGATLIYIFQSGLNFYKLAEEKTAETERLEREYAQTRLQALKNQVNPHFLFNSLSVLSSLVHVSPETSDKFIQQLSRAYRYILDQKNVEWVTLHSELQFLDAYFFLLKIRFNKKIVMVNEIDLDKTAYILPPLTLQLLLENAVKHNKMSSAEPLVITLTTNSGYLHISNNINRREQHEASTGIGLENIQKRYAYITDKKIEIVESGQNFIVSIPLVKNNNL